MLTVLEELAVRRDDAPREAQQLRGLRDLEEDRVLLQHRREVKVALRLPPIALRAAAFRGRLPPRTRLDRGRRKRRLGALEHVALDGAGQENVAVFAEELELPLEVAGRRRRGGQQLLLLLHSCRPGGR